MGREKGSKIRKDKKVKKKKKKTKIIVFLKL